MFCVKCGTENDDGAIFCSKCGKSPTGDNIKYDQKSGPMARFVRKAFRKYLEVILWINLIVFTIGGWNFGNTIKEIVELVMRELIGNKGFSAVGYPLFGAFLGTLVGLLVNIILGGLIATITNMDDKIEQIEKKIR